MEPSALQPLQRIPLHIVSKILGQLDTISQLRQAILSHRIFHDALADNLHSVAGSIIANQIPTSSLPFAIALLESTRIQIKNQEDIGGIIDRLGAAILDKGFPLARLARLSLSDYAFMSRNYSAVEFLGQDLANASFPLLSSKLGVEHQPAITPAERLRLDRGVFRYQLMCNLLCSNRGKTIVGDELDRRFFHQFSPWVNEQLACVYGHLERKVNESFLEYAHVIEWGSLEGERQRWSHDSLSMQWVLRQGLPCLASLIGANGPEERIELFWERQCDPGTKVKTPFVNLLRMMSRGIPIADDVRGVTAFLNSYTKEQFKALNRPLDGPGDSTASSPFRAWVSAHAMTRFLSGVFNSSDRNLWHCGYVIWDYPEIPHAELEENFIKFKREGYYYPIGQ